MKSILNTIVPTVLIVDDNPKNVQIIALTLRELNYKIVIAMNGQGAVDMTAKVRPDLILLDVMMPGMDGFEACQIIKEKPENENIPIIFLTALSEKTNIVKGFGLGAVDYITKPFNKEELVSRIKTHLELKFTRDQLQDTMNHLTELNELKDKMFSVIGHDLRSPLGSIKMTLEFLTHVKDYEKIDLAETIDLLSKTTDEVYNLLDNLLAWAKSQSGNISMAPEAIDLEDLVNDNYLLQKGNLSIKNITFKKSVPKGAQIFADLNMIKTVLRNLLSNAIKFTADNGTITVDVVLNEKSCCISVLDSGVGIPPENLGKLFDDKQHLTTYGTNKEAGSGLGLILCKTFVDRNNGRIWVDSEPGNGSKFSFELPLVEPVIEA